jgi:hypothetical protein
MQRAVSSPQSEAIWKIIPLYTMWCICKEINDRSIEDNERTLFFFFFYVGEPIQGRAIWTYPCKVNPGSVHRTLRSFPT